MTYNMPIAQTGDNLEIYEKILTVSDGTAYTAGDNVGELLEISTATWDAAGTGKVVSFGIVEYAAAGETLQKSGFRLYLQKTTFDSGLDNAAFDLTLPANALDIIGIVGSIAGSDYTDINGTADYSFARKECNFEFGNRSDNTLYGRLIAVDTPTYDTTAGSRLILRIVIKRN